MNSGIYQTIVKNHIVIKGGGDYVGVVGGIRRGWGSEWVVGGWGGVGEDNYEGEKVEMIGKVIKW